MMPDRSSTPKSDLGMERPRRGYGLMGVGKATLQGRSHFMPVVVPAETFFRKTLEALHRKGLHGLAESFQRKAVFLDLGVLGETTTFIVWIGCPKMYERFTDLEGAANISAAASEAAKALGLAKPVRTVIALFAVKSLNEVP